MNRHVLRRHPNAVTIVILGMLSIVTVLALGRGAVDISPVAVLDTLAGAAGFPGTGDYATSLQQSIILSVRLPRILLGLLAGGILAITGVLMQAFFRNPLADPALIGVSAGGALGAVAMIVLGSSLFSGLAVSTSALALPGAAFLGSLTACGIVFGLARREGHVNVTTMLLCGIAVNAMAGAGIGLLSFLADDAQLRDLTFWSLGSLGAASWWQVAAVLPSCLLIIASAPFLMPVLNALLLGDSEARHLGYDVERLKLFLLLLTCSGAGAVVATSGVIGFIGLIAPHLSRLLVGPNHRYVIPISGLFGATLLTLADMIARTIVVPAELPIGILTALIGGPIFLWLLRQTSDRRRHA